MIRNLMVLLMTGSAAACATTGSTASSSREQRAASIELSSRCAPLTGVRGTIGNVTLTRVGTTTFHVRPGLSVPPQPNPHYPYFIVDTAAPTRVAYWGQSGE